jgi:hypothetical protein
MKARLNSAMLELLGGDPEFHEPSSIMTPDALVAFATSGFKVVEGCVVLASYTGNSIWTSERTKIANVDDETGFECSLSEIHIEDFFESDIGLEELARSGNDFAFQLGRALLESGIDGPFRTIVSARCADQSVRVKETCTVRFHKLRPGQVWLDENLEAYNEEAIAVLDFAL